jgi:dihydroorotate dehydrogenase
MSWFYRRVVRPILFSQSPERIHDWTIKALGWTSRHSVLCDALAAFHQAPALPVRLFGLSFPNPVGLAAGMDKGADALLAWAALGFGFSELGAVTRHAQPGNAPPRVFRAIADEAIINRMGFNNAGAENMAARLACLRSNGQWPAHPVGINLGKSKVTPLDQAAQDYAESFRILWPHADFFVVNVSSPNTPNLRQLQDKSALDEILAALQEINNILARLPVAQAQASIPKAGRRPVLVKVAPDLTFDALDNILALVEARDIAGIVATNTTTARPPSADPGVQTIYAESGGLSGRPLGMRSTEVIRHLHRQTRGSLPIIGVGGIFNADDAWEKIVAGASLLQLYTGLVFEGPGLPRSIVRGLIQRLQRDGFASLQDAVGCSASREPRAAPTRS